MYTTCMKYLVGLGNPGKEYTHTRHNIGFLIVDEIHSRFDFSDWEKDTYLSAIVSKGTLFGQSYTLIKPVTFMNLSGNVVQELLKREVLPDDICVIYDDLAYPFSTVRLAYEKGSAGHNGIASIINQIKSPFLRIRVGIHSYIKDSPDHELIKLSGTLRSDFVLKEFCPDEKEKIPSITSHVLSILESLSVHGIAKTMTEFNARS